MPRSQTVQLRRVDHAERSEFNRLIDEYLAELSVHREAPEGPTEAESYAYLPLYWKEAGRYPFFLVGGGTHVGFVLIREVEKESIIEMSDFYIRPASRRSGLGRAALSEVWRRFPGVWRLQVHPRNEVGAAFWLRCIEEFASGNIEVREIIAEDGRRLQYGFKVPAAQPPRALRPRAGRA